MGYTGPRGERGDQGEQGTTGSAGAEGPQVRRASPIYGLCLVGKCGNVEWRGLFYRSRRQIQRTSGAFILNSLWPVS